MTPEVLIVGDPTRRRGFAEEVEALGYVASLCEPRELNRRVRTSNPPTAIVACIGDVDPDVLLAGLRRTRAGASIPVLLYGRLGGSLRDLADVLDIGADHFLEESISPAELADALSQYAGTPRLEGQGRTGAERGPSSGTRARARVRGLASTADGAPTESLARVALDRAKRSLAGDRAIEPRAARPRAGARGSASHARSPRSAAAWPRGLGSRAGLARARVDPGRRVRRGRAR